MVEKHALRGAAAKISATTQQIAKVLVPICLLLVLLVWNSPTLLPSNGAFNDPIVVSMAVGSREYTIQDEGRLLDHDEDDTQIVDSEEAKLRAQYDSLMTQTPTQIVDKETGSAGIASEETREKTTESKEEETREETDESQEEEAREETDEPQEEDAREETEESQEEEARVESTEEQASTFIDFSVITGDRNDVVNNNALKRAWEELRSVQLPYRTRKNSTGDGDGESCDGRSVYVYDLPSEFNADLQARCDTLFPWLSLCDFFADHGRGTPVDAVDAGKQVFVPGNRWFNTHQYALEMVSHERMLKYKCRTKDPRLASLFYIPYYGGLDVIRWHFHPNATNEKRDELALRLFAWLDQHESWRKEGGRDHVLVLGKISFDFRRQPTGKWGSRLLSFPDLEQVTKVMIERDPWEVNDIGVPHPTYFHPQSASDISQWLDRVRSQARTTLVTFVGKERKNDPTNARTALVNQCRKASSEADCRFVECSEDLCLKPAYVTKAFLTTHFCMQPVGDSPTRRSLFDSLIAGCIPVLFHPCTAYVQYPWHLPANESSWSVYIAEGDIRSGAANVVDTVMNIPAAERDAMRENIISNVIPGLLYSAPGSDVSPFRDAFDITTEQLLFRIKQRMAQVNVTDSPAAA